MKPSSITASAASSRSPNRLQPLEPPRHHLAQPRRDRDLAGGVHRRRQLLREERVPRRRALDGAEGAGRQRAGGGPPGDRRKSGAVERAERNLHRVAALEQARAHERGRLRERLIAHAGDHEQALAGGAASEMVHERRRCLVGGVQVVDHQHDPALRGGLLQQLGDRREDAMAVHGPPAAAPAGRRTEGSSRARAACALSVSAPASSGAPRGERVERLHKRRVRRAALLLVAGAAERVESELLRLREHGLDEARLADPQRARDE